MYRELNRKRIILERRMPFKREVADFINEVGMIDFIHTSLRLEGSTITREMITGMLKGAFYPDVSLNDHARVQRYRDILSELENMRSMKMGFSEPVFSHVYCMLEGTPSAQYRENNPVVFEWEYNPPHPREISGRLDVLLNWIERDGAEYDTPNPLETPDLQDEPSNFVLRAAYLHHRLLSIYPYTNGNAEMARIIMYYYLLHKGYPVFDIELSDQEYNGIIADYLKDGDVMPFCKVLEKSLGNKMNFIAGLTAIE